MHRLNILGVNLSVISKTEALNTVQEFLNSQTQHYITTPNPEIILAAGHDEELFHILNQADLSILDGFGLKLAAWASGERIERYPGADLVKDVLALAESSRLKLLVLNWQDGLSTAVEIEAGLKLKFPKIDLLVINIDRTGVMMDFNLINKFAPIVMLVNLGAPFQEKVINQNLKKLSTVKLAIGIGGALDFLTGKARRAPKIFRLAGLEWLWRLIKQPTRFKRILNAVVVFPYKFIIWKVILPFFYRENVVCLLYKQVDGLYEILIVERAEHDNHWQLPQGGTDGEALVAAGARELSEELNCSEFRAVAAIPKLWKYKFKDVPKKRGYETIKHGSYKGQKQGLFIAEFLGEDACIKINYWDHQAWHWVDADKLVAEVYPTRRASTEKFLEKFNEVINDHEIKS